MKQRDRLSITNSGQTGREKKQSDIRAVDRTKNGEKTMNESQKRKRIPECLITLDSDNGSKCFPGQSDKQLREGHTCSRTDTNAYTDDRLLLRAGDHK